MAENFAKADPYVVNGLVKRWHVREWTTVVGDLSANPPTPAQQLATFDQKMKDLQAAVDKAAAELKIAEENASQSAKELKAATDTQTSATKAIEAAQAQINSTTADVTAKSKAAK